MFLSFPEGTEMFQFPSFALTQRQCRAFNPTGCPIRISPDLYLFAVPRSFSQLTTSFFASESLGIHLTLFLPSSLFGYFPNSSEKLLAFEIVLFYFQTSSVLYLLQICFVGCCLFSQSFTYVKSFVIGFAPSLLRHHYKTFLFTSLSIPNTSMNFFSAFLFTSAVSLFLSPRLCFSFIPIPRHRFLSVGKVLVVSF